MASLTNMRYGLDAPCPTFGASSAFGRASSPRSPRPDLAVNWRREKLNLFLILSLTYQGGYKPHCKCLFPRALLSWALHTFPRCLLHPQWSPCDNKNSSSRKVRGNGIETAKMVWPLWYCLGAPSSVHYPRSITKKSYLISFSHIIFKYGHRRNFTSFTGLTFLAW